MYKKILIAIFVSLVMTLSIAANTNTAKDNNNNDKEPGIKISMDAISVAFSNTEGDGVGIKDILLLAEKYCIDNKIDFPIRDSEITMCIEQNKTGKGIEIKVYFWDDAKARRKVLIITINNRQKVSGHAIHDC